MKLILEQRRFNRHSLVRALEGFRSRQGLAQLQQHTGLCHRQLLHLLRSFGRRFGPLRRRTRARYETGRAKASSGAGDL
jgi:hypothetical protein